MKSVGGQRIGKPKQLEYTLLVLACFALPAQLAQAAQTYRFDTANSYVEIHLGTAGFLGFLGHGHLIRAPVQQGTFVYDPRAPGQSSVELVVAARQLKVIDPELSAQDRQKVQNTMDSDRVLAAKKFSTITFKSTSVASTGENQLVIRGNLTVRGKTNPVTVHVSLTRIEPGLIATGQSQFKQTQLGIKPVKAGLGTVRVQDQMTIDFRIQAQPVPSG